MTELVIGLVGIGFGAAIMAAVILPWIRYAERRIAQLEHALEEALADD